MQNYEVLVLFGGISNENEISVITGTMVCNVLKKGGKSVLPVYVTQGGEMLAGDILSDVNCFKNGGYKRACRAAITDGEVLLFGKRGKIKARAAVGCALNCCHGGSGEGGGAAGLFALNNIPFASAGLFESAAFMDKYITKIVLGGLGVKVAPYVYLRDASGAAAVSSFPVIVKPCKLGSSIGVVKADNAEELERALVAAFEYDDGAIVERYFSDRREINCAAYYSDNRVITSECEEAFTEGELLSFDDKYAGGGRSSFPADLPEELSRRVRQLTGEVYSALNMRGIVRFDYILCGDEVYLSEINTVPGSLSYYLLSAGFADFYSVLCAVIKQAKYDFVKSSKKRVITTGILNNFASNACKIK